MVPALTAHLPGGGGLVDAECFGGDRGGDLDDELSGRGDPSLIDREAEPAEMAVHGVVRDGLAGIAAGEQPIRGWCGYSSARLLGLHETTAGK
jgi:hypothetical protein